MSGASLTPTVSIVIGVHNGAEIIGDCIESLLNQSYPASTCEVIVIENGSTDDTATVVSKYPVVHLLLSAFQTLAKPPDSCESILHSSVSTASPYERRLLRMAATIQPSRSPGRIPMSKWARCWMGWT